MRCASSPSVRASSPKVPVHCRSLRPSAEKLPTDPLSRSSPAGTSTSPRFAKSCADGSADSGLRAFLMKCEFVPFRIARENGAAVREVVDFAAFDAGVDQTLAHRRDVVDFQ